MRQDKSDSLSPNYDRLLDRYIPWEQRWGVGKALRDKIPREKHADWTERKDRPDPIDLLIKSNESGYRISCRSGMGACSPPRSHSFAGRPR
jgi:hypothetical protein